MPDESASDRGWRRVVDWVESQPRWQAECCWRLSEQDGLSDSDIEELLALAKAPQESEDSPLDAPTLSAAPPRTSPLGSGTVALQAIKTVRHANALDSGDGLGFAETGLTVVYGKNGTGKSGYVRILKRLCRARSGSKRLRPDIYASPSPASPATATIEFTCNSEEKVEIWTDGGRSDPLLSRISVFDADCATVQVAENNEIAFLPPSLAVLDRLADVARDLRIRLTRERDLLKAKLQTPAILANVRPGSTVGRLLASLSAETDADRLGDLATWADAEELRLSQLQIDLAESPARRASHVRAQLSRLESTQNLLSRIDRLIGDDACGHLLRKHEELAAKQEAVRVAANAAFGDEPLPGVGSTAWRALWDAARRFSRLDAYPGEVFPVTSSESRCVLCLQGLGQEAQGRLTRFAEFVSSDVQQQAEIAGERLAAHLSEVASLSLPRSRSVGSDLESTNGEAACTLRRYVVCARKRRALLLRRGAGQVAELPSLPDAPRSALAEQVGSLRERLRRLTEAAASGDTARLTLELEELEDRRTLHRSKHAILEDIQHLKAISILDAAIDDTDTAPITRLSTAVAREVRTPALRDAFESEIQSLRLSTARVELVNVGGSYGAQRYRVKLIASPDTPPDEILSEGEHTGVALAGFLAELATANDSSGIVLDDPVSSLDHRWRRAVAERLVREAAERQVIIFTHDAVFLLELTGVASREGVTIQTAHILRRGRSVGVPHSGPPWIAMSVKKRLGFLRSQLQEAEAVYNRGEIEKYEPLARHIYGLLRATWERTVEELLLNGVVVRFGLEIQTRRLEPMTDLCASDIDRVKEGMTKCSRFLSGHDEAAAVGEDVPGPDEIRADIDSLADFASELRRRGRG